jgi:hypothetical protein
MIYFCLSEIRIVARTLSVLSDVCRDSSLAEGKRPLRCSSTTFVSKLIILAFDCMLHKQLKASLNKPAGK